MAKGEKKKKNPKDDNLVIHSSSSDSVHHVIKRKVVGKQKRKDNDKPEKSSSKASPKKNQALLDDLKDKTNALDFKNYSEIEVTLRLQLVKRCKQHLTESVKKQITEIENMSNKEALLKERLIQIKKDEIERLEFSDGLEFGLTDIRKHIDKINPQANDSIFSETDIEDLISKYDSKTSNQNDSFSDIDFDLPLPLPTVSSLFRK